MNIDNELDVLLEGVIYNEGLFERGVNKDEEAIVAELVEELEKVLLGNKKDIYVHENVITIKGTNIFNKMSSVKLSDVVEGMILRKYYETKPPFHITVSYFKMGPKAKIKLGSNKGKQKVNPYTIDTSLVSTTSIKISVKKNNNFKLTRVIKFLNNKNFDITYEKLSEETVILSESSLKDYAVKKTKSLPITAMSKLMLGDLGKAVYLIDKIYADDLFSERLGLSKRICKLLMKAEIKVMYMNEYLRSNPEIRRIFLSNHKLALSVNITPSSSTYINIMPVYMKYSNPTKIKSLRKYVGDLFLTKNKNVDIKKLEEIEKISTMDAKDQYPRMFIMYDKKIQNLKHKK